MEACARFITAAGQSHQGVAAVRECLGAARQDLPCTRVALTVAVAARVAVGGGVWVFVGAAVLVLVGAAVLVLVGGGVWVLVGAAVLV